MDPFSDALRSVRLAGAVFLDAAFTAPWCVTSQLSAADCRPFLEAPASIVAYHVVIAGTLLVAVAGEPPLEVGAGEIVLLPRNDVHVMASGIGLAPVEAHGLVRPSPSGGLSRIVHGGGGAPTRLVCGFLGSEAVHPLLAALPRLLKLDLRQDPSYAWIEASVRYAADEVALGRIESSGLVSRLSELLLVEALRWYTTTLPTTARRRLDGLGDRHVGKALALMHERLDEPWSAVRLAREVALSRSAFVDRFTSLVGVPPIRYLTSWRLQTAKHRLRETRTSLGELAPAVGYASVEAFSRAFKREFGLSPGQWRDGAALP